MSIAAIIAGLVGTAGVVHYGVLIAQKYLPELVTEETRRVLNPADPEDAAFVHALCRWVIHRGPGLSLQGMHLQLAETMLVNLFPASDQADVRKLLDQGFNAAVAQVQAAASAAAPSAPQSPAPGTPAA